MAAKAGVKRFIFISSVKVNGEGSGSAYTENNILSPEDQYGISKLEAENVLMRISSETGLQTVILRSPHGDGRAAERIRDILCQIL